MDWARFRLSFSAIMAVLLVPIIVGVAWSQGLPQSPYSAPSVVRGGGLDLAPSNPLGFPSAVGPRTSDSILLTPQLFQGILPQIPNLQVGYLYTFGKNVKSDRLTLDYLLPVGLGPDSVIFAEAHGQFSNFWNTLERWFRTDDPNTSLSSFNKRKDLSFGAGIRKIFGGNTLVGFNGFYDATKLGTTWYKSGSVGFEYAWLIPNYDAFDFSFNWYGHLFNKNVLINAWRRGPENLDLQFGYSHELWEGGPDLRLSGTAYRFQTGRDLWGGKGSAELKTRDGMFLLKYDAAYDDVNKTYHTVGAFINVAFGLDWNDDGIDLAFRKPEPIFRSPLNFRRKLTQPVAHRRSTAPVSALVLSRRAGATGAGDGCETEQTVSPSNVFWNLLARTSGDVAVLGGNGDISNISWTLLNPPTCDHIHKAELRVSQSNPPAEDGGGEIQFDVQIYAVGTSGTRALVAGTAYYWNLAAPAGVSTETTVNTSVVVESHPNPTFIAAREDIDTYLIVVSISSTRFLSRDIPLTVHLDLPRFNTP